MSYASDSAKFVAHTEDKTYRVYDRLVDLTFDSVVVGSSVTGSPGQPVGGPGDTHPGQLRDSWQKEGVGETEAIIYTTEFYAPTIEDGVGFGGQPLNNPSHAGGYHSGKLTVAGFDALGEQAEQEVST